MPTPTYLPLATITLATATGSVAFANIPTTFRDLVVVANWTNTGTGQLFYRMNLDSGANYAQVFMSGAGGGATSNATTNNEIRGNFVINDSDSVLATSILNVMDYSTNNKHKSCLLSTNNSALLTAATAARYLSNTAISQLSVNLSSGNFTGGSTFNLYGIVA